MHDVAEPGIGALPAADFISVSPRRPASREPMTDQRIRRRFVDIPHGQVHVRTAGTAAGIPLIMLHPSPGSSKMLEPLVRRFAETRTVFALDTLGNGDSSPPAIDAPPLDHFVEAHLCAIDGLALGRIDLYGSHTGGNIACEIAIRRPERVRHLILDGMSLYTRAERDDMLRHYAPALSIAPDASHLLWLWNFVRDAYLFWPWYKRDAANRRTVGMPSADALHDKFVEVVKAARTFHLSYQAAIAYEKEERLPLVRVPTLLSCARDDMLLPYLDRVAALMPAARRMVTSGWNSEADAADTLGRMIGFLDRGEAA